MSGGNCGSGDAHEEGQATCSASDFRNLKEEIRQQHAMLEQMREQISTINSSNTRILDILSTRTAGATHAEHAHANIAKQSIEAVSSSNITALPPNHKEEQTSCITKRSNHKEEQTSPADMFAFASLCFPKD